MLFSVCLIAFSSSTNLFLTGLKFFPMFLNNNPWSHFLSRSNNISFSTPIATFNLCCLGVGFWFIGTDVLWMLSYSVQSTNNVLLKVGGITSFDKGFSVLVEVTEDVSTEGVADLSFLTSTKNLFTISLPSFIWWYFHSLFLMKQHS